MGTRHWAVVLAVLLAAGLAHTEVWNFPGGISATDTSQQIDFPQAIGTITVYNDDPLNSIHVRLFDCGETPAAASTTTLEIKAGQAHTYRHGAPGEVGLGYCSLTVVCEVAGPCGARVEGGGGVPPPVPDPCPCFTEAQITAKHEASCTEPNRIASCGTGGGTEFVLLGCNPGAFTVGAYVAADTGSPGPQCQRDEELPDNDLTVDPITAEQRAACGAILQAWEAASPLC